MKHGGFGRHKTNSNKDNSMVVQSTEGEQHDEEPNQTVKEPKTLLRVCLLSACLESLTCTNTMPRLGEQSMVVPSICPSMKPSLDCFPSNKSSSINSENRWTRANFWCFNTWKLLETHISFPYFAGFSVEWWNPNQPCSQRGPSRMNALHQAISIHAQRLVPVAPRLACLLAAGWE